MNDVVIPDQVNKLLNAHSCEASIEDLEKNILNYPQVEIPPIEGFANGMYTREILIPAGTLLTGRVHKYDYIDIMLSGDIAVATPQGSKRLKGPNVCDGKAGRKRAGYAFDDTRWVTVHRVDQWEEGLVDKITFFSKREYQVWFDRKDFINLLIEGGYTPRQVIEQSANEKDRKDIDLGPLSLILADSDIHGTGLFTVKPLESGDYVGPARTQSWRTQLERYANHSSQPNIAAFPCGNGIIYRAIRPISPGSELVLDYRQVQSLAGNKLKGDL